MIQIEVALDELALFHLLPGNTYPAFSGANSSSEFFAPVSESIADAEITVIEENGKGFVCLPDSVMNDFEEGVMPTALDLTEAVLLTSDERFKDAVSIICI